MKVKFLQETVIGGKFYKIGENAELDKRTAKDLVFRKSAELTPEKPENPKPKPEK